MIPHRQVTSHCSLDFLEGSQWRDTPVQVPFGKHLSHLVRLPPRQVSQVLPLRDLLAPDVVRTMWVDLLHLLLSHLWTLIQLIGEISASVTSFGYSVRVLKMLFV